MADTDESLVGRRSKRSTAGNRMEAALAEMTTDDLKDTEDDIDFINERDEEDVFESDFESTDEETAQDDPTLGDTTVQDEEKRARKAARTRVEKATAAAHARQKVTFNPQVMSPSKNVAPDAKLKRRVSLARGVDGQVVESVEKSKRQSKRKHTVLNTSATVTRMRNAENKRAAIPKKVKIQTRIPTQDELIARALDNEEGNIVEHRDYLRLEEEKRKRAQVVRIPIHGPVLRWVSKGEETQVKNDPPHPQRGAYSYVYPYTISNPPSSLPSTSYGQMSYPFSGASFYQPPNPQTVTPSSLTPAPLSDAQPSQNPFMYSPYPHPGTQPTERTEKVSKSYVIHELGQYDAVPKPPWQDTMEAMFGDHVDWEQLRVYVGKGRPLGRPKQMCLLTGQPAPYLDPRTGVPYANAKAYHILSRILAHEYIWSDSLGCYVGEEGGPHAQGLRGSYRKASSADTLHPTDVR